MSPAAPHSPEVRKRGLLSGWWTMAPSSAAVAAAFGIAWWAGSRQRPEFVPYVASLYLCTAFFGHAYSVAWRAGAWFWQGIAWVITMALLVGSAMLHIDDANARVIYVDEVLRSQPTTSILYVAAGLDLAAASLLLLHGAVLGNGSRVVGSGAN